MDFEFDPRKSRINKGKHGVDFNEARALWEDDRRLEIPAPSGSEERWMVTGIIASRCWTAVVTYRGERIRLISVRRAREEEQKRYEKNHEENHYH